MLFLTTTNKLAGRRGTQKHDEGTVAPDLIKLPDGWRSPAGLCSDSHGEIK